MFRRVICPNCGTKVDDAKYACPNCDHKFEKNLKNKAITLIPFWRQIIVFVVGFLFFQLFAYGFSYAISAAALAEYGQGTYAYYSFIFSIKRSALINFTSYFVIFGVLIGILVLDAHDLLKTFRGWRPIVAGLIGLGAILVFNMIYNSILSLTGLVIKDNANENSINSIVSQYPILSLLVFGFIGPICEEITYRVGLFSFFSRIHKILAYVLTIIIFAFIHFDFDSSTIINELLNMPLYGFAAFVFSYLYDHYGFAGSVYAHISNNVISIGTAIIGNLGK